MLKKSTCVEWQTWWRRLAAPSSVLGVLLNLSGLVIAAENEPVLNGPGVFFVAPDGRDHWSGKLSASNSTHTDGPFATLGRARQAVRAWKSDSARPTKAPIRVFVRGGEYFLDETLVFTAADGGSAESPVVYAAYPGERPVLSGGRKVQGWQSYKGPILRAAVPEAVAGKWKFRQLFYNGQRQIRARYPNVGYDRPWRTGWLTVQGTAQPGSYVAFRYPAGSFPRHWANPGQGEVFMAINWGYTTLAALRSIDEANRSITLGRPVRDFARPPWVLPDAPQAARLFRTDFDYAVGYRFFVENLLEELDQPGEWCWDATNGVLYFWPPAGGGEAETVVPVLECLVDLRGAAWLTLSGFTFTETVNDGENMHRAGLEGTGAMFPTEDGGYCGEAVHLKDAEHCRLEHSRFLSVGGNAVYLEGYNFRNTIQGNEISQAGHCGVVLMGTRDRRNHVGQHPLCNDVVGNYLHHCGVFDVAAVGVFCGVSDGNVIGHNRIEQMPHHAINLGNHGYGRNIVEYNDIRHVCQESYDNAAINCWMEDDRVDPAEERSGHVFRFNRIRDTPGPLTFGIYLDNFSSGCWVYGNLIVRTGLSAIRVNGGRNNLIENNIIIGGKEAVSFWPATVFWPHMKGFMTANRFERNIVYLTPILVRVDTDPEDRPRVLGNSDDNLFFGGPDRAPVVGLGATDSTSLTQWKSMGYDERSLLADPLFADPATDDYRLKPESPAWKLGIPAIDVTRIGPTQ